MRPVTPETIEIRGPAGVLEGLLECPPGDVRAAALICHPHPLHQGTMNNKVVYTLARSFYGLGMAALRFNFRGVGASQGRYGDGVGEREDAVAAAEWIRARWPRQPLYLGGFSFGAMVAITVARRLRAQGLVTVAPPLARLAEEHSPPDCPWLVVQGTADELVSADAVAAWVERLQPRPELVLMHGADHFFHGRLVELRETVTRFFEQPSGSSASAERSARQC